MTSTSSAAVSGTYTNPVYASSFPDPFVLKFKGEYFAYCTGLWHDERVFGVLRSTDLMNWLEVGGAMQRLDRDAPYYWAPEVSYHNGKFYLYYSVGNETLMEIRLAVSDSPAGGFVDQGVKLTGQDFAIDPHIFTDSDGRRYMFYATDFLDHQFIGTGTVVDRMLDWRTLEGDPRPVTRAKYDWQVYDPARKEKGGVRWHTVEGPFVLKRKGRYYEMFSGGNWQNTTYGVSFAATEDLRAAAEWEQFSDGEKVLPILKTIPERIVGPGHNSVVRGPNNRELYCVYHRWTENGRALSIDRMDFSGNRIFVVGPTDTPQPEPFGAKVRDEFDPGVWQSAGKWEISGSEAVCSVADRSTLTRSVPADFLFEVSTRCVRTVNGGSYGFAIGIDGQKVFEFLVFPSRAQASIVWTEDRQTHEEVYGIGEIDTAAAQLIRCERFGEHVKLRFGETDLAFDYKVGSGPARLSLCAAAARAAFSGLALTQGFEELFDNDEAFKLHSWGLETVGLELKNGEVLLGPDGEDKLAREIRAPDFELACNLRLIDEEDSAGTGGILISIDGEIVEYGCSLEANRAFVTAGGSEVHTAPVSFDPREHNQFRVVKIGRTLAFYLDGDVIATANVGGTAQGFKIFSRNASAGIEMVRLTII